MAASTSSSYTAAREERDLERAEMHVGTPAVTPLLGLGDSCTSPPVERHRILEVAHLDREICHTRDGHEGDAIGFPLGDDRLRTSADV